MSSKLLSSLEINANSIYFTQSEILSSGINILSVEEIQLQSQYGLISELQRLKEKYSIQKTKLITALPRHQIFLKKITIPQGTHEEIKKMLKYEAEKYLPFSAENAVIDYYPIGSGEIYLVAVKKETIDKHLKMFNEAGLFTDRVGITTFAINSIIENAQGDFENNFAFIRVNSSSWEIDIFSKKQLLLSRGGFFAADKDESILLEVFQKEITSSFNMFGSSYSKVRLGKIYCAYSLDHKKYIEKLSDISELPINEFNINNINIAQGIDTSLINQYIIPIGLSTPSQYEINLIPADIQEKTVKKQKVKSQLTIARVLGLLFIIIAGSFLGINYNKSKENRELIKKVEKLKPEILKLAKTDKKLKELNDYTKNNMLIMNILKEISKNLPKSVYIRQMQYDYEENSVTIRGRASSYNIASKAISIFGKSQYFTQVSNKGSHAIKIGDKNLVDFEVVCSIKGKNEPSPS
jgi:Tfp pilus assembly protein PilN